MHAYFAVRQYYKSVLPLYNLMQQCRGAPQDVCGSCQEKHGEKWLIFQFVRNSVWYIQQYRYHDTLWQLKSYKYYNIQYNIIHCN